MNDSLEVRDTPLHEAGDGLTKCMRELRVRCNWAVKGGRGRLRRQNASRRLSHLTRARPLDSEKSWLRPRIIHGFKSVSDDFLFTEDFRR